MAMMRKLRQALGIDRAVFFTVAGRGWSAFAGPVTLLFVAHFLSAEEQGFYYTFASVLALQVFFELGLSYVIMQVVSHEHAHLQWASSGTLEGDPGAKARLASILRLVLKWYAVIAAFSVVALGAAGLAFFRSHGGSEAAIDWPLPWLLVVCLTGGNLLLTPLYGLLEGCGKIAEIAAVRVYQGIVASFVVWLALAAHLKLYATCAYPLITFALGLVYLVRNKRSFFFDLLSTQIPSGGGVNWRRDILPFQWKISLSWLSGYFIFQLANPVMFRFHGPVEAGRMGMTLRIVESIAALGAAWVSTKSAPFGNCIARRDFATLDRLFRRASWQSIAAVTFASAVFLGTYFILRAYNLPLVQRLLDPLSICFLLGNAILNCIVLNQALYLRAHKEEPFLLNSLLGAILVPAIMYTLGRPFGGLGISAGFFFCSLLIGLPIATAIFYKKRRQWHAQDNA